MDKFECPVCKKQVESITEHYTKNGWKKRCPECYREVLEEECKKSGIKRINNNEFNSKK